MKQFSVSVTLGDGNIGHNSNNARRANLENVDNTRIKDNIYLVDDDIKETYHVLFDDAIKEYNNRQKRKDRIIDDYYAKIGQSKKITHFKEMIIQIGNEESHPDVETANIVYKEMIEYMQKQFSQMHIFGAYIHNDEATPHMHVDFIPYGYSAKGLSKCVSMDKALAQSGFAFEGDGRERGKYKPWRDCLVGKMEEILKHHDMERLVMNNTERHDPNVAHFKRTMALKKEIEELEHHRTSLIENPMVTVQKDDETAALINNMKAVINEVDDEYVDDIYDVSWMDEDVAIVEKGIIKKEKYVEIPLDSWIKKQEKMNSIARNAKHIYQSYRNELSDVIQTIKRIARLPATLNMEKFAESKEQIYKLTHAIVEKDDALFEMKMELKWYKGFFEKALQFIKENDLLASLLDKFSYEDDKKRILDKYVTIKAKKKKKQHAR